MSNRLGATNLLRVAALAGIATAPSEPAVNISELREVFRAPAKRVNGFEHVLAKRSAEFRMPHTNAPAQINGSKEMARRRRQMERAEANRLKRLQLNGGSES